MSIHDGTEHWATAQAIIIASGVAHIDDDGNVVRRILYTAGGCCYSVLGGGPLPGGFRLADNYTVQLRHVEEEAQA